MPPFIGFQVEAVEGGNTVSYNNLIVLHVNGVAPTPSRGGYDVLRCKAIASAEGLAKAQCEEGDCISCTPANPCSPTKPPPPGTAPGVEMAAEVKSGGSFPSPTMMSLGTSTIVTLPYAELTTHEQYVAMLAEVYGDETARVVFHFYRVFQSAPTLPPHPLHNKVIAIPVAVPQS